MTKAMLELNEKRFIRLLGDMVAHGGSLQNAPSAGLVPKEVLAADLVEKELASEIAKGKIKVERFNAPGFESRPSLVISMPGETEAPVGLVGAHFDVVPADREAENWKADPFKLGVSADGTLYGRGVTDCLGHVALLTDLIAQLCERDLTPRRSIKVVMIANEEEAPIPEVGLDYVVARGAMDDLKEGVIYWLDSADFGPTVGTGGMAMWRILVTGVTGHSGMPHNCVNALEVGMAACFELKRWFERNYPPHPNEKEWGFLSPSSLKATVISVQNEKVSKIPGAARIEGDIRLTPFYDLQEARSGAALFIRELSEAFAQGKVPEGFPRVRSQAGAVASLELVPVGRGMEGIACHLDSPGLSLLEASMTRVLGADKVRRFSMTGSLPLVRDLQRQGFDVQITGFGRSSYYHAPDEQANLEHFRQGFAILREVVLG